MFAADLLGQYFTLLKCCNSLLSLYVFSQRLPEKLMFEKYIHQDSVICLVWRVLELKQHSNRMFALWLSFMFVLEPDTDILDDRHNSEISENHGWQIKRYRQSWKQSWHCKSSVNDQRNMMASECHFCLSM